MIVEAGSRKSERRLAGLPWSLHNGRGQGAKRRERRRQCGRHLGHGVRYHLSKCAARCGVGLHGADAAWGRRGVRVRLHLSSRRTPAGALRLL